jgi:hypothetical protein
VGEYFVTKEIRILEISINWEFVIFLIPNMTCFKGKKFYLSEEPFFKFLDIKAQQRKNLLKMPFLTYS